MAAHPASRDRHPPGDNENRSHATADGALDGLPAYDRTAARPADRVRPRLPRARVDTDSPVAYLVAERVDGNLHIEQVSVRPDSARRGIGRALLEHLAEHATNEGVSALTLTTFTDVPWNAPSYARCGFRFLDDSLLTPGLRRIREREAARGLDRWPRACMIRDL